MENETYLGDGVYAFFDGRQIRLRAQRVCDDGDDVVYLDGNTLAALARFVCEIKAKEHARDQEDVAINWCQGES